MRRIGSYELKTHLSEVLDAVEAGVFSPDEPERYRGLVETLRHHDYFMICADFDAYYAAQRGITALWREQAAWTRASILNTAGVGWFSSDRAIREYAAQIWGVPTAPPAGWLWAQVSSGARCRSRTPASSGARPGHAGFSPAARAPRSHLHRLCGRRRRWWH